MEPIEPSADQLHALGLPADYFKDNEIFMGKGCPDCTQGYRGRIGIYEIFMLDEGVQELIYEGVAAGTIRRYAREHGMRTLREDGLRKVAAGISTLEEVVRVTAADEVDLLDE